MQDDTQMSTVEKTRLMILIEQMQRQGRSEGEIEDAVREATTDQR